LRGRALILLLAASLGLAACRVDTTVAVRVHANGGGTVTVRVGLDPDAVRAAEAGGGKLEGRVRLGDLPAAGWTVSPWARAADGSATLTLSKPFTSPAQVHRIVAELNGLHGPLRDVTLGRSASAFRTRYRFGGVADLAALGTGMTDDQELLVKLAAERVDIGTLDRRLLGQLREAFRMNVRVRLPGGGGRTWTAKPGERAVLRASSSTVDTAHVVGLVVGVSAGVIAVLLLVVGKVRTGRRRRRGRREPQTAGRG
jgi:hypothetical protein